MRAGRTRGKHSAGSWGHRKPQLFPQGEHEENTVQGVGVTEKPQLFPQGELGEHEENTVQGVGTTESRSSSRLGTVPNESWVNTRKHSAGVAALPNLALPKESWVNTRRQCRSRDHRKITESRSSSKLGTFPKESWVNMRKTVQKKKIQVFDC